MNIAIVGCGYVADYYLATLRLHKEMTVLGITDRLPARSALLSTTWNVPAARSLNDLLDDQRVEMVLNLTNPREHLAVSQAVLESGKHVYSEKPLAMAFDDAKALVEFADSKGLQAVSAPCSVLSETAQTIWKALRAGTVGQVRAVYAEMDDGLVPRMAYRRWLSTSGLPWPYKDEFEVGCTLEHAGYVVSWLVAWFGAARSVTAFGSAQLPDKVPGESLVPDDTPDLTVACIAFESGVVARLTCSIVAPHDHVLRVFGDEGVLYTPDTWHYRAPVYSRRWLTIRRRTLLSPFKKSHPLPPAPYGRPQTRGSQSMDFARGPAEVAAAIREGRASRLSSHFSLHVNEIVLAIHHAGGGATVPITSRFAPPEPMPWA